MQKPQASVSVRSEKSSRRSLAHWWCGNSSSTSSSSEKNTAHLMLPTSPTLSVGSVFHGSVADECESEEEEVVEENETEEENLGGGATAGGQFEMAQKRSKSLSCVVKEFNGERESTKGQSTVKHHSIATDCGRWSGYYNDRRRPTAASATISTPGSAPLSCISAFSCSFPNIRRDVRFEEEVILCLDNAKGRQQKGGLLGRGETSEIYACTFHGVKAAVKLIRTDVRPGRLGEIINMFEFEREVLEMSQGHPSIIQILGSGYETFSDSPPRPFLVLQRLECTLSEAAGTGKSHSSLGRMFLRKKFPVDRVATLMLQVAEAIAHLHSGGSGDLEEQGATKSSEHLGGGEQGEEEGYELKKMIIHRDIKPTNIALDSEGNARVLDFGLATCINMSSPGGQDLYGLTGMTGSLRYMAPETAMGEDYNESADVYSWAIVFVELLNLEKPFSGMNPHQFREEVIIGGHRPIILPRKGVTDALRRLIQECWAHDFASRPTMSQVVIRLKEIQISSKKAH